jgi:repressor of nif and glnA expression
LFKGIFIPVVRFYRFIQDTKQTGEYMGRKIEKKRLSILKILKDSGGPVPGSTITEELNRMGSEISERTVRFHLLEMDREGLTRSAGKQGRMITDKGVDELSIARIYDKVGFLTARIDEMTTRSTYDIRTGEGSIVVNVSLIKNSDLPEAVELLSESFSSGYTMGELITLFEPGKPERGGDPYKTAAASSVSAGGLPPSRGGSSPSYGGLSSAGVHVPWGYTGIGTVSSININAVLLKHGVPARSVFGGILEIAEKTPVRFMEIIKYGGTSIDPLEVFIKGKMTDINGIIKTGNGKIGASFIEFPESCRKKVIDTNFRIAGEGLGGLFATGWPGKELFDIPVNEGRVGGVVPGGLNAVAYLEENGIGLTSSALSTLVDVKQMFSYRELKNRVR